MTFPDGYPVECECDVVLSDGLTVHVRPILPDDGERLVAFHAGLSPDTVYRRFFSAHPRLSDAEVERFTHVDYANRLALVALQGEEFMAVARFDRRPGSDEAEVAFVVGDASQGRGLGTLLLEHLATAARGRGIVGFEADTLAQNSAMLRVFKDAGFEAHRAWQDGVVRVTFPIASTEGYQRAVDDRDRSAQARSIAGVLRPRSIAVVGAGRRAGTIGHEILANLLAGGFAGPLYAVNRAGGEVLGVPSAASLADIAEDIDLIVVAVPAAQVPEVVDQAGARHARGLVVITAGFAETGAEGAVVERQIVQAARRAGMRVVGPNCMGILNADPAVAMNATFSPAAPIPGRAAFLSQSGALGIAVLERASQQGLGVSSFVSVGNKADVSGNDLLAYWGSDPSTDVILLYLESFGNPRKFARLARTVSRTKPIVAVKSGRSSAGKRAAQSHTASAAVLDVAVDALFRQTGVVRVDNLADLLDTAAVLANQPLPRGPRVGIVGNSGGPGILAADACVSAGLEVPELSAATQAALAAIAPPEAALRNPVDLVASASGQTYEQALRIMLADEVLDAIVVIFTPPLVTKPEDVADAVARVAADAGDTPIVANFLSVEDFPRFLAPSSPDGRPVPCYPIPERAVAALARAHDYAEWVSAPQGERPNLAGLDRGAARRLIDDTLAGDPGGAWLDGPPAIALARSYGIPVPETLAAKSAQAAAEAADRLGYPVALKAEGIVHKTDVGGVRLGLSTADEVLDAYAAMAGDVGPGFVGVVVQPIVAAGVETIVGLVQDPSFGPLVMFGLGGVATELLGDRAFRILPLTDLEAHQLIRSLRASPLLTGYRGAPAADTAALEEVLLRVAQLGEDFPEVAEVDLNPVMASASGVCAVDVKIRIAPAPSAPDPTMRRLQ